MEQRVTSKRELGLMAALVLIGGPSLAEPFGTPVTTGKSARAFAPKGFKIERETKANLTGDGVTDLVVVLVPKSSDGEASRGLLFLRGEKTGVLTLIGSSASVLPGSGDCGVKGEECKPEISVKTNVVSITVSGGSRESWRRTLRVRPNNTSGKVEQIGRDEFRFDGLTEASESTRIN